MRCNAASEARAAVDRVVQLDYTAEMEVLCMLFEICHTKKYKAISHPADEILNFKGEIQLDHPVAAAAAMTLRKATVSAPHQSSEKTVQAGAFPRSGSLVL